MPRFFRHIFILSAALCFAFLNFSAASAAVITWDDGGGDSNWSTCDNWVGDSCPGSGDVATFDATSDTAATIDSGFAGEVLGVDLNIGYTSTITQAAGTTLLIGNTDLNIAAGTVTMASDGVFNINDDFIMTAGTFNAGGTVYVRDDWTDTSSATFNHSNGTVVFDSNSDSLININTSETFYNFTMNKSDAWNLTVASGDSLIVVNAVTLTNGDLLQGGATARIEPQGSVVVETGVDPSTNLHMEFTGSEEQTLDLTGIEAGYNGLITVNKSGGTLTMSSALTMDQAGQDLTIEAGTFDPNGNNIYVQDQFKVTGGTYASDTATLELEGDLTISAGTFNAPTTTMYVEDDWIHTAGGTYNHSNGTVVFDGNQDTSINVDSNENFYNLTVDKSTNWLVSVVSGDSVTVLNQLDLLDGRVSQGGSTSRIYPQSHVLVHADLDTSNLHIEFTGTAAQNFTLTGGEANWDGLITINKASETVTLLSDLTMDQSGQDFFVESGTFDPNGFAVSVKDQINISGGTYALGAGTLTAQNDFILSGGVFNAPSTTMYVTDDWTHTVAGTHNNSDGTVEFIGGLDSNFNGNSAVATSGVFHHVTLNKTNNFQLNVGSGDTMTMEGDLVITDGRIIAGNTSSIVVVQGNIDIEAAMDITPIDLQLTGGNVQTFDMTGAEALWDGHITINKSGGQVNLLSNITVNASNKDFILTAGVLDMNGNDLTVNGTSSEFTISGSATLQRQGGETITTNGGFPTHASGWTAVFDGTSAAYTLPVEPYHHLTISGGASSVFSLPGPLAAAGDVTINSGTLATAGNSFSLSGTFSNSGTLRLNAEEFLSFTNDTDSGTIEYVGDGDAASDTFPIRDLTYYNLEINTTDSEDTFTYTGTIPGTMNDSLVAHWKLDETTIGASGSIADSGGSNPGTPTNISVPEGPNVSVPDVNFSNTRSWDFDGSGDRIVTTLNVDQDGSDSYTYAAWVKPEGTSSGRHHVISTDNSGFDWSLLREGGTWYVFNGTTSWNTGKSVTAGVWQHVAAVFEPGVGVRFYLDGVEVVNGSIGTDASSSAIDIGDNPGGSEYFDGMIDDVRIYNTALSAGNISVLSGGDETDTTVVSITSLNVNGDLDVTSGSFTAPATTNIGGSFNGSAGVFAHNSGAVNFTGTGTINSDESFNNLTVNTAGTVTLASALDVNGLLTLTGGTFDVSGSNYAINLAGGWTDTGSGTFTQGAGNVTFDGTGTLNSNDAFNNVIINTVGTTTLGQDLDVDGSLTITSGTLDVSGSNYGITVGGNWANSGTFTKQSGTVTFDSSGVTSTISGTTNFHHFTCTTADKPITFTASTTTTISGLMTLTGTAGNLVTLRSSSADTTWLLNVAGTSAVDYVDVKDSDASGGNAITHASDASRSTDSGNNTNWSFNDSPTVNLTSAAQISGSPHVSVAASVDDPDDDTTVSLKLEYSVDSGSTWTKATVVSASTSAGSIAIDNDATYQIGTVSGYIDTSSGSQAVTVIWDADADSDGVDISTVQLRLYPYDQSVAGSVSTSSDFGLDLLGPTGLTALHSESSTSRQDLTWTAVADSNFSEYKIYYSTSLSDVNSKQGTVVDQTVDSSLAVQSTSGVRVIDDFTLTYIKIYAFDSFGNESTVNSLFNTGSTVTSGGGGGGGGSSSGYSSSSSSSSSDTSSSDDSVAEETSEDSDDFESLGVDTPEHWSSGYVKNLETEVRIIEAATSNVEFLTLLIDIIESPDDQMSRGEALYFLITLAGYDISGIDYVEGTFSDVSGTDDYSDAIQYAHDYGLINGYPDGSFQSERVLNRAEALKLCFEFFQIQPDEDLLAFDTPFTDVDVLAWYYPYLVHAVEYGVIEGYMEDMTFRPAQEVSYSELLKIATLIRNIEDAIELASELTVDN
jgi:hypothetical protein